MSDMRCPKHDVVFETVTDQRKPGAGASGNLAAHPANGHPDCPLCAKEAKIGGTNVGAGGGTRTIPPKGTSRIIA